MWMTEVGIVVREISEDAMPLLLMEEEATTQGMQASLVARKVKGMSRAQPRTPPLDGPSLDGTSLGGTLDGMKVQEMGWGRVLGPG